MTIYLTIIDAQTIQVQAVFTNEAGDLGDLVEEVHPGETWEGWTFEELTALGNGEHQLDPKPAATDGPVA